MDSKVGAETTSSDGLFHHAIASGEEAKVSIVSSAIENMVVVVVVAFSMRARILGKWSTIYSPHAPFF